MNILPIQALSFKSKLPSEKLTKGGLTQDYWSDFINNQNKYQAQQILHQVSTNGRNDILALEATDKTKPFVDYHFKYYASFNELENDRINNPNNSRFVIRENKSDSLVYMFDRQNLKITEKFKSLQEALTKTLQDILKPEKISENIKTKDLLSKYRI